MRNPFEVLGITPRPFLDESLLRKAYFAIAKSQHPDIAGDDGNLFRATREAYDQLRRPASRLRALAEIAEPGTAGAKAIPPADLFGIVAHALEESRRALARPGRDGLAKALAATDLARAAASLNNASAALARHMENAHAALMHLDEAWPDVPPAALRRLAGELSFLDRWERELSEARLRVSQAARALN